MHSGWRATLPWGRSARVKTTDSLDWRVATLDDVEALERLVNSAYRGDSSRQGWTTEAELLGGQRTDAESLRALVQSGEDVLLVVEEKGELVACVNLRRHAGHGYLGMLTVRPTRQTGGLGRRLLAIAEAYVAREWGLRRMEMTVIVQRPELIAWYERRGYRRTERRERFPYGDPRFGLPKRDDLEFVVLEKAL